MSGLDIIDSSQKKVNELQLKIKEEEPELRELEIQLTAQNEQLKVV